MDGDGDLVLLGPPLAITREQVDEAVSALGAFARGHARRS